jgi:hypothetical protein
MNLIQVCLSIILRFFLLFSKFIFSNFFSINYELGTFLGRFDCSGVESPILFDLSISYFLSVQGFSKWKGNQVR